MWVVGNSCSSLLSAPVYFSRRCLFWPEVRWFEYILALFQKTLYIFLTLTVDSFGTFFRFSLHDSARVQHDLRSDVSRGKADHAKGSPGPQTPENFRLL